MKSNLDMAYIDEFVACIDIKHDIAGFHNCPYCKHRGPAPTATVALHLLQQWPCTNFGQDSGLQNIRPFSIFDNQFGQLTVMQSCMPRTHFHCNHVGLIGEGIHRRSAFAREKYSASRMGSVNFKYCSAW